MAGALSLDDQLLGEKMDYYCSSSEDEYQSCDEGEERARVAEKPVTVQPTPPELTEYSGKSTNVGYVTAFPYLMSCISDFIFLSCLN